MKPPTGRTRLVKALGALGASPATTGHAHRAERRKTFFAALAASALAVAAAGLQAANADSSTGTGIVYQANPPHVLVKAASAPAGFPTVPSACIKTFGFNCYTPAEIRTAFDVPDSLTGAGQTIVIVDAFGSPTIASDLHVFDQAFGLPDPQLNIFYPTGKPTFNANSGNEVGWAFETTLDVEWAHAIAPAATIDLVVGTNYGCPNCVSNALNEAQQYAVDNHLGNVMSLSFGVPEAVIPNGASNPQLRQADQIYEAAKAAGITVVAADGDSGAGFGFGTPPSPSFPASDPSVLSVGGTDLFTTNNGAYRSETVWNDFAPSLCPYGCSIGPFGATGGAPSSIFPAPSYQQGLTGFSMRTTSDVSYNGSVYTGVLVYVGFFEHAADNGYYVFGGTSAGAPQWAAITALADQAAGHALGFLNPSLYAILGDAKAYASDFHDVTVGNNEVPFPGPGFNAGPGYDLPTGLGTPDAAHLISTLTGR